MRGDNFEFEQTFSIFLLVNHRPVITGTDLGIWRRMRLVPWTGSIPLAEQRPQDEMVAELMADGAWMLRWIVCRLRRLAGSITIGSPSRCAPRRRHTRRSRTYSPASSDVAVS